MKFTGILIALLSATALADPIIDERSKDIEKRQCRSSGSYCATNSVCCSGACIGAAGRNGYCS
ncbi:hypothetical protein K456DRAFT_1722533 [Colletotrichum gloeosporioides 23]|nr:hypothetical protein K456DRAFT_1722533 [Colletotrichum gloeosporioides 23]KAJ0280422.1 hypothetical protein COL940_006246 [Colletotrichum noveboracense]